MSPVFLMASAKSAWSFIVLSEAPLVQLKKCYPFRVDKTSSPLIFSAFLNQPHPREAQSILIHYSSVLTLNCRGGPARAVSVSTVCQKLQRHLQENIRVPEENTGKTALLRLASSLKCKNIAIALSASTTTLRKIVLSVGMLQNGWVSPSVSCAL